MFKFDFQVQEESDNPFSENKASATILSSENNIIKWYDAKELLIEPELLENFDVYRLNSTGTKIKDVELKYIVSGYVLQDIKMQKNEDTDIKKAEESHSDLIPGIYEGGGKVWECTNDLLDVLADMYSKESWGNKRILDLGCGSGLLGIYALNCEAKEVTFQDYNQDVVANVTMPNVLLNMILPENLSDLDLNKLHKRVKFYSGDWASYIQLTESTEDKFDVILTSETIYNPQNQRKLLDTFHAKLKQSGVIFVAAKTYYFGVGGGTRQFEELIKTDGRFQSKVLWVATEGVSREIIQLTRLV